jgi:glc operon protein GlcG
MFRFLTATATFALLAGPARADHTLPSLGLADAQRAIAAALAAQPTVKENVAVVDAGGQLVAFVRQDGAISAGVAQASAAAGWQPIYAQGAIPIVRDGIVDGAVGCGGGTSAQDEACAQAGAGALMAPR